MYYLTLRLSTSRSIQEKHLKFVLLARNLLHSVASMRAHQRTFHVKKRRYVKIVARNLTAMHELKRHRRIHTGEATHICPTCHKSFTYLQEYVYSSTYNFMQKKSTMHAKIVARNLTSPVNSNDIDVFIQEKL